MRILEWQLLWVLVIGVLSLLLLALLTMLRVGRRTRTAIVARIPDVLFGLAIAGLVGIGFWYS